MSKLKTIKKLPFCEFTHFWQQQFSSPLEVNQVICQPKEQSLNKWSGPITILSIILRLCSALKHQLFSSQLQINPMIGSQLKQTRTHEPFLSTLQKVNFCPNSNIFCAGCCLLHPEELSPHAKNYECGYWCLQIWPRNLHNWHFLKYSTPYKDFTPILCRVDKKGSD